MEATAYQERLEHINEHKAFIETLMMMRSEGEATVKGEFAIKYISDWLKYHLHKYDRHLTDFINQRKGATHVYEELATGLKRPKAR